MKRFLLLLVTLLASASIYAQKTVKVDAEYTYVAPENVTLEQAKQTALDRAKIQTIADEFGTIVSQQNSTIVKNQNGESSVDMLSLGGSEIKGEWIETLSDPLYTIDYTPAGLAITVKVKGRIREIKTAKVEFSAKILCNGTEERFERTDFRSGDDLFLSFRSPVNGFLAVYLVDNNSDAFCLLPYQGQTNGIYPVEANRQYVLFSEEHAPKDEKSIVDEYTMAASESMERNQIYVIFSPNPFTKATDLMLSDGLPRQLNWEDFQRWLSKCRRQDKEMRVEKTIITIKQ